MSFLCGAFHRIRVLFHVVEVFLFAHREINFDRINCGDRRQRTVGAHKVANLRLSDPGKAVDRGGDFGIVEIQFGLGDFSFGRRHRGFICQVGMNRIIEILLADYFFFS